jgi:signal transduction histidine kinase
VFRSLSPTQLAVDIVIGLVALGLRFALGIDSLALAFVVVMMAAALSLRRLSPGWALAVAWVGAGVQMIALLDPDSSNLAIVAVLYTTARYGTVGVRTAGLISAGAGAVIATAYSTAKAAGLFTGDMESVMLLPGTAVFSGLVIQLVAALAVLGLSWTLGQLTRSWAAARESRRDRAAAEERILVEQERNRIARDMHDVVAHSLAVVIAQADGVRYSQNAPTMDAALATIAATSRSALADVRLLLAQLRHRQEAGPQPMLGDLDALIEQVRDSGLTVEHVVEGRPVGLPAGHQLALYRIAQEALTNALRHGDPSRITTVRLVWELETIELSVSNRAPGASEPIVPGHGLTGMRERALLVGGTCTVETRDGDVVVTVRIPVAASRGTEGDA